VDVNRITQFIQNSRGLRIETKMFYKIFFVLPVMFLLVFINGEQLGVVFSVISVLVLILIFAVDLCYLFCIRKRTLKYNLLLIPIIVLNTVVPLFYITCLSFYDSFGLRNLMLYYILPFAVLTVFIVLTGISANKRKICRKSQSPVVLSGSAAGAAAFFISHKISKLMATTLSDTVHFIIIAVSMLLLSCFMFSVAFFDLLRYHYFAKLEKKGLVTEETLSKK